MKRLLGKKSDKKSSGTDNDKNPYAQTQDLQAEDAYSRQTSFAPSYTSTARHGASGRNPNASASAGHGYGNETLGATGGFGSNPYNQHGQSQASLNSQSSYNNRGPQGYGGMAGNQSSEGSGANRDQLFGGARATYAQPGEYGSSTLGNNPYGGYGAQRELTEEEQEEEVVQGINRQANDLRDDSVQITRRGVAMAYQMLEVGTGTGEKLDEQTHRFDNMKSNLHTGNIQTRQAAQQTKNLQRVNGSMWNPANYIGKKERAAAAQQHTEDGSLDLAEQEAYRKERYDNMKEIDEYKSSFARKGQLLGNSGSRGAKNYDKYLLETDDMEQRDKEDELDANLDEMSFVLSKVKLVADANLKKVDKHIQTIGDVTDMSHNLEAKVRRVNNNLGTMK